MKMSRSGNGLGSLSSFRFCWILMAAKIRYSVQTEKGLARNENEPFWQWFGKPIQISKKNSSRSMNLSCFSLLQSVGS